MQGVVRGVIGGSFQSIATISGTLYLVIKQSAGGIDLRKVKAKNLFEGLYHGLYGIGEEVIVGLYGVVKRPYIGCAERQCIGGMQGCGEGLAGVITSPATGALRATESISQGMASSANDVSNLGRTRLEMLDTK